MDAVFEALSKEIEQEKEVRHSLKEVVKDLEEGNRKITGVIQGIHANWQKASETCDKAKVLFKEQQERYTVLGQKVNTENYYKYNGMWKNTVQRDVFLYTFIGWVETGQLATHQEVQQKLCGEKGIPLELENYLIGVTYVPSELSRLCMNSVIAGDYKLPQKIAEFVKDLYNGFQLLNLKNDFLRKRFDGIKYDLKKIEEVNFEVALRGLAKKNDPSPSPSSTTTTTTAPATMDQSN